MVDSSFLTYLYDKLSIRIPVSDHQDLFQFLNKIPEIKPVLTRMRKDFKKYSTPASWFDESLTSSTDLCKLKSEEEKNLKQVRQAIRTFNKEKEKERMRIEMEQLLVEIDCVRNGQHKKSTTRV